MGLSSFNGIGLLVCICFLGLSIAVSGRPATFLEDFRVTWADNHVRQLEGGRGIQLILDQSSGNFVSYSFIFPYMYICTMPSLFEKTMLTIYAGCSSQFFYHLKNQFIDLIFFLECYIPKNPSSLLLIQKLSSSVMINLIM